MKKLSHFYFKFKSSKISRKSSQCPRLFPETNEKTILQNITSDLDNNYNLNYNSDIKLNSDFTIKYLNKCGFNWPIISKEYITQFIRLIGKGI